jgi:hypothetical protein
MPLALEIRQVARFPFQPGQPGSLRPVRPGLPQQEAEALRAEAVVARREIAQETSARPRVKIGR